MLDKRMLSWENGVSKCKEELNFELLAKLSFDVEWLILRFCVLILDIGDLGSS